MSMRALITGVEGQDGYYLSKFLAGRGYEVYGIGRQKAQNILPDRLPEETESYRKIYADIQEFGSLCSCIGQIQPDEVYNLAGLSAIPISWRQPVLTADVNGLGVLRLLEAIRLCAPQARFLQSSSSEILEMSGTSLSEKTPMATRNPYGTAKLYGHWITRNYRESYGMFACAAILFNHESPRRGIEFVTRKISAAAARICLGMQEFLEIGNLDAVRDWGSAEDYVRAMWLLLQQESPDDYVIATGVPHTVRDFIDTAFYVAGMPLIWEGEGLDEVAREKNTGILRVRVNPELVRPPREDRVVGDPAKAREQLGFVPERSFEAIVEEMVMSDLTTLKRRCK